MIAAFSAKTRQRRKRDDDLEGRGAAYVSAFRWGGRTAISSIAGIDYVLTFPFTLRQSRGESLRGIPRRGRVFQNAGMSFRRSKVEAQTAMRWREFLAAEQGLFAQASLPGVLGEREKFDDFLMHGFLPMPGGLADGTMFSVDELNGDQREALERLVALYVERFGDPGVAL
jgi:hypothetical protein